MRGQITLFHNSATRRIAVVNHKGGTGKTTTAVHLAAGLAARDYRVLLVDADPQGNLGTWFGLEAADCRMSDLALGRASARESCIEVRDNLDLVASDWRLAEAEERLIKGPEREQWLRKRLSALKDYDFVIVDCAPSMSILTTSALAYAEEVVIPISMEYLALVGVRQIIDNILRMGARNGRDVRIAAVVPTFYQANLRKNREILRALRTHFRDRLTEPIRASVRMSEAPSHRKTIFEYAPRSPGANDYHHLVDRFADA